MLYLVLCVWFVCILCFVFFFKQQPAYEMRISDWSSDVCSSDLAALARLAAMPAASLVYVFGHGQFIQAARAIVADAHLDERAKMRAFWRKGEPPAIANAQRVGFHWEGGRWSCAPALAGTA